VYHFSSLPAPRRSSVPPSEFASLVARNALMNCGFDVPFLGARGLLGFIAEREMRALAAMGRKAAAAGGVPAEAPAPAAEGSDPGRRDLALCRLRQVRLALLDILQGSPEVEGAGIEGSAAALTGGGARGSESLAAAAGTGSSRGGLAAYFNLSDELLLLERVEGVLREETGGL
jgi:hypothetical protein